MLSKTIYSIIIKPSLILTLIFCGLKTRLYTTLASRQKKKSYTLVSCDSGWTLANGSLNADLYYSDRLNLVEKGNLKMAESMFNSIEVSNNLICGNHNNKSRKSYNMAVPFKLNNADFPPLPFSSASKPV